MAWYFKIMFTSLFYSTSKTSFAELLRCQCRFYIGQDLSSSSHEVIRADTDLANQRRQYYSLYCDGCLVLTLYTLWGYKRVTAILVLLIDNQRLRLELTTRGARDHARNACVACQKGWNLGISSPQDFKLYRRKKTTGGFQQQVP